MHIQKPRDGMRPIIVCALVGLVPWRNNEISDRYYLVELSVFQTCPEYEYTPSFRNVFEPALPTLRLIIA
ncbi:hypothetical protein L596_005048 [Steinernema carpocapsae]|uniref:Uncharacterized protein n=1 Tax=Steinernema carpocapsae TaxID=34508 RepID=A0A4U8V1B3_STECR|nr:hypothetical protein L596_005048 [Steinernema carpocapsae]